MKYKRIRNKRNSNPAVIEISLDHKNDKTGLPQLRITQASNGRALFATLYQLAAEFERRSIDFNWVLEVHPLEGQLLVICEKTLQDEALELLRDCVEAVCSIEYRYVRQ